MIRRKDTVSYVVFIRGLYTRDMLAYLAQRMTQQERENIENKTFDELWNMLWCHHPSKRHHHRQKFKKQKERAKQRFERREWEMTFKTFPSKYTEPEWGFPKGRKRKTETSLQAAVREFCEETGLRKHDIIVDNTKPPIKERYTGSDSKEYEIMYYLANLANSSIEVPEIDASYRSSEISNIGWFDKSTALQKIRDYHVEKRRIIYKLE